MRKLIICLLMVAPLLAFGGSYGGGTYGGSGGAGGGKPGITLPDTIFVHSGREINLWSNSLGVTPAINPPFSYSYDTAADTTWGLLTDRQWRWRPLALKTLDMSIKASDFGGRIVETKGVVIAASANRTKRDLRRMLFVGDSMFGQSTGDEIFGEVDSLFSTDGGGDAIPVGAKTQDGYNHEGNNGWTWAQYVANTEAATDTNRFWDRATTNSRLDFQKYSEGYLGSVPIDYVIIHLGGNEAVTASGLMSAADIDAAVIAPAKAFIDTMMSATYGYPDCKIVIMLSGGRSAWDSAWSADYTNNSAISVTMAEFDKNIDAINRAYISAFDGGAYHANADVVSSGSWVDPVWGYPYAAVTDTSFYGSLRAGIGGGVTEGAHYGTNALHPRDPGRNQMADAVYSHLRHQNELDSAGCANQLVDSDGFKAATDWSNVESGSFFVLTTGQADPWGGTDATLFEAGASYANNVPTHSTDVSGGSAVELTGSLIIKNDDLGTDENSGVTVWDRTSSDFTSVRITWTVPPTVAVNGTLGTATSTVGMIDLGAGWYRIWIGVDLSTDTGRIGHDFDINVYPAWLGAELGDGAFIAGAEFEFDTLEPCGTYIQKP